MAEANGHEKRTTGSIRCRRSKTRPRHSVKTDMSTNRFLFLSEQAQIPQSNITALLIGFRSATKAKPPSTWPPQLRTALEGGGIVSQG